MKSLCWPLTPPSSPLHWLAICLDVLIMTFSTAGQRSWQEQTAVEDLPENRCLFSDTCSQSQLSTYLQVQYIPATQIKSHRSRRQLVLFIHTSLFSLFSNSPLQIIVQLSGHSTDRDVSGLVPCVCVKSCDPGQLHCEGDGSLTGYPIKEPERTNAPSREANEGEMRHHPQRSKMHSRCRTTLGGPGKVWSWLVSVKVTGC